MANLANHLVNFTMVYLWFSYGLPMVYLWFTLAKSKNGENKVLTCTLPFWYEKGCARGVRCVRAGCAYGARGVRVRCARCARTVRAVCAYGARRSRVQYAWGVHTVCAYV